MDIQKMVINSFQILKKMVSNTLFLGYECFVNQFLGFLV